MDTVNTNKPPFLQRLFSWRTARRATISVACFVTLVALFYTEEDWRGQRAWEQCKRELKAAGFVLDWSAYIPPPVPDDQNFYKAPGLHESDWVGRGMSDLGRRVSNSIAFTDRDGSSLLMAEVTVTSSNGPGLLRMGDTHAPAQARKILEDAVGPEASAAQGFTLVARSLDQIHPATILLSASATPTSNDLVVLFPDFISSYPPGQGLGQSYVHVEPSGHDSFRVLLTPPPETAADYLVRLESFKPDFDALRGALERPFARPDGNYSEPLSVPIPRFQTMRAVAQTLANQTKCHLLLGNPDEAVRDLALLHGFYHVLQGKPTGQPMTLVAAMINIAIVGLYADTMGDGFRLHAWREPQLLALQQQLAEIDLFPILSSSFVSERAASVTTLENAPADFNVGNQANWRERMRDPFYNLIAFAPRGWIYQNLVFGCALPPLSEIGDDASQIVQPANGRRIVDEVKAHSAWAPYSFLSTLYLPNGSRAWAALACNQTKANEALLACALERYRLTHGDFPPTLVALAPQFLEKIPHDLIGGQPLHYHRNGDGTFLLYSIAWNEKDDGGQNLPDKGGNPTLDGGDWVWLPNP